MLEITKETYIRQSPLCVNMSLSRRTTHPTIPIIGSKCDVTHCRQYITREERKQCLKDCAKVLRDAPDATDASERLRKKRCQHAGKLAWLKPECYELTQTIAQLRARLDGLSPGQYIRNGLDHLQRIWERLQRSVGINWARVQSTAAQYKLNIYGLAQLTQFFADLRDGKFKKHLPSKDILLKVLVTISVIMSLYFIVDSNRHLDELQHTQEQISELQQDSAAWATSGDGPWRDDVAWEKAGYALLDRNDVLRAETTSHHQQGMVATWLALANLLTALISGTILTYQKIDKIQKAFEIRTPMPPLEPLVLPASASLS